MRLVLPWPPSVNTYWRHPARGKLAGRHLISAEGRAYRYAVLLAVPAANLKPLNGSLAVTIHAIQPDKRRRDADNLAKAPLDALTAAGVWGDDSQIRDLRIVLRDKCADYPRGALLVEVGELVDGTQRPA